MSGTIPLSMTAQFNEYGEPLSGGRLYIIQVGTVSTPQDAFQDTALTIKQPYPMLLDAAGRVPQFFLADGFVKIRLQDKAGVVQLAADSVMVIGPSSGDGGGGGGVVVDPSTIYQTGDLKTRYGTGTHTGWVRCNGRTIGSATSSATERNAPDTQALFQYLWSADLSLVVVGGRGASAAADWGANKQLTLPDMRGRVIAGMDDMGNTAAGRMSASWSTWSGAPTVLGAAGGVEYHVLSRPQMAQHNHAATSTVNDPSHQHAFTDNYVGGGLNQIASAGSPWGPTSVAAATDFRQTGITVTTGIGLDGGDQAHNNVQPTMVATHYIKL